MEEKVLDIKTCNAYNTYMKFQEIEKIILKDGWRLKNISGSHYQYIHNSKLGKVTIPYHSGDLHPKTINSILKQAGMK
jgi:predicted RNA binding protein YcfA (HicA-like mRNA interferase family)